MSRGAAHVCFVESAGYAAKVIAANAELLGVERARISIRQEMAGKVLGRPALQPYQVVFIDPPYQLNALGQTIVALLKNGWVKPARSSTPRWRRGCVSTRKKPTRTPGT